MKHVDYYVRAQALRLLASKSGVSVIEFALVLPLLLMLALSGFEMTNYIMAKLKVQRLASMTADQIAQQGDSQRGLDEMQIYDIFSAIDVAAQPLNIRRDGRVIITAVIGEDTNGDGVSDRNRIRWQRFAGGRVRTAPAVGCHTTTQVASLKDGRRLGPGESMFHVQVTYQYASILGGNEFVSFVIPTEITSFSAFRGRGTINNPILAIEGFPPLNICNGL